MSRGKIKFAFRFNVFFFPETKCSVCWNGAGIPPDLCRQVEYSACSCLTQLILFDGRGVLTLLPKVQLHVSALDINHLQVYMNP